MPWIYGTATGYQAIADILSDVMTGTSLHSIDSIDSAGTGYSVGDELTVSGGTATIPAILEVLTVGGSGEVTSVRIRNAGLYTVAPSDPVAVTGGGGSGAEFNLTFDHNGWVKRRAVGTASAVQSAAVNAGGTGYTVGDELTVSGGTASADAVFEVTAAPGGVVSAVVLLRCGNYSVAPSNPASTTGGSGSGCTLDLTFGNGTDQREIVLEGEGSGADEIFAGWRTFSDASSGARNLELFGLTGFGPAETFLNQPGLSPGRHEATTGGCYIVSNDLSNSFWIRVTPRAALFVVKAAVTYSSGHVGLLNPYATEGEWPYPLFICGTTSTRYALPSTTGATTMTGVSNPKAFTGVTLGPGQIRHADGTWRVVNNWDTGGSGGSERTNGILMYPTGRIQTAAIIPDEDEYFLITGFSDHWLTEIPVTDGTQQMRTLPTEDSGGDIFMRVQCTLFDITGSAPQSILGDVDGLFWFPSDGSVAAENRLAEDTTRFFVANLANRTDIWNFYCIQED